ncbi:MAG: cytochrome c3 family protein [Deltaproteobacteria bacterium]
MKSLDRLDCLSCHVPHDQGQPKLLRQNSETAQFNKSGAIFDAATKLYLSRHEVAAESSAFGRSHVRHQVGIPVRRAGRDSGQCSTASARGCQRYLRRVR